MIRRIAILLALALTASSALALTFTSFENGYTSAALPAAGAWGAGSTAYTRKADTARLFCTYKTATGSTTGYPEIKVQLSPDAAVTWYDFAVCDDATAGTTVAGGVDNWQARCYVRTWYIDTPGVALTTVSFPVIEIDLRGVSGSNTDKGRIRMQAREAGNVGAPGTMACTWGLGMTE